MSNFKEIKPNELDKNTFELLDKDWMLITAEKEGKVNTMTASWGGFGAMWGKDVAYVVIRPQRFTKEFVDSSDTFSLSILDNSFRKTLNYLGSVSGRDESKVENSKLTVAFDDKTPYFEEANTVFICRKMFAQEFKPESFLDKGIEKWYPGEDYHTLYIAEILKVLIK